jgi:ribosomal protein S9
LIIIDCMRKSSRGEVLVKGQGSGKITINGKPLVNYFESVQDREQVR